MFDISLLDTAVGDALSGGVDSALIPGGVWNIEAAQGTELDYLTFQEVSDGFRYGIRGSSTLGVYRYLVRAVTEGPSPMRARAIDAAAYAALHDANLVVPGVGTVRVKGDNGQSFPDPEGNFIFARFFEITLHS